MYVGDCCGAVVSVKIDCAECVGRRSMRIGQWDNISLRKRLRLPLVLLLLLLLSLLSCWGAGAAEARKAKANERVREAVVKRIVYYVLWLLL